MRRNIKDALKTSIKLEEQSVNDRFEKAEALMRGRGSREDDSPVQSDVPSSVPSVPAAERLRRETFTIPESDYQMFRELKVRCMKSGFEVAKSELVRAGLKLLAASTDENILAAINQLERLKVGRKATH